MSIAEFLVSVTASVLGGIICRALLWLWQKLKHLWKCLVEVLRAFLGDKLG